MATAENQKDMEGKIFNVNPTEKSFELLVKTAYDPVTREEKSRHTVYWTDKTAFTKVISQKDFKGIKGPVIIRFNIQSKQTKALTEGRRFTFKHAEVDPESKNATGLSSDGKELVAWFTPDHNSKNNLDGTVSFKGKTIKAGLRGVKATVDILLPVNADELSVGIWKAKLSGKNHNDKFIIDRITIYPQKDPRKTDVPGLPRVLVIGDSISINYHNAARNKLKGIANYYREETNCGPSDRGVECMNLWLGDYTRKGFGWDIIQFNHGLHDLRQKYDKTTKKWGEHQISVEDYKKNLEKEIIILKKTGAQLIWCTTTPVPNSSGGQYGRRKDEDLVYNKAALEVIG
ncbi:MAG: SGNH/GDSL hydrolase family protein, partial [Victivallales bacterium]|nr:SGNH/GDSL hydrolase family protein [Victivallales bacterium]